MHQRAAILKLNVRHQDMLIVHSVGFRAKHTKFMCSLYCET